jgi:DNA (cytosine-5)-methyltransferase 1
MIYRRSSHTAISLFTGAGGLDLGMEAAGFETRVAVEFDQDCITTLEENRDWPVIARSIHDVPSAEILASARLAPGEADLLIGGPPCQPFSKSGYWANGDARRLDDPRATTLDAYLRVLRDTRPRAFLLENVTGLAYDGKDEGYRLLTQTILSINRQYGTEYHPQLLILNAVDFGVPQTRERAFVIGARDGTAFGQLAPTHRPLLDQNHQRCLDLIPSQAYRTAWDALWDLEDDDDPELRLTGKWADLLPSIPEGQNYLYHTARGGGLPLFGWRRRFWNFLLKLAKDLPSWTLTAQPGPATGPFHWRNRRLSARELCRLQTIPDDYHVVGNRISVQRQIGNAVPSALAEVIGLEIRCRLLGDSSAADIIPTLVPLKRTHTPPPAPVTPVMQKYRHLIGDHEAHPGTGKGNRARRRAQSTAT